MNGSWQDLVFSGGFIFFIVALLPTLFGKNKPPVSTSLGTGLTLGVLAFTFGSLSLWFSAITESVVAVLWLIIAVQVARRDNMIGKYQRRLRERKDRKLTRRLEAGA